ncbi:hypothetical protein G7Y79_00026g059580 [Physcia stellaris]|nr:hypothetical protein G7Y79_00026g059580 [Physcia stellaris]
MIPAGSNFSGAAIWGSQPSIDPKRNQVFIATGNIYTVPESYDACVNATAKAPSTDPGNATDPCLPKDVYQEALLAFNIVNGHINWSRRLSPLDAWNLACVPGFPGGGQNPGACPDSPGPDADFGIAPTFVPGSQHTPHKQDILVIGQKNGNLYALAASDGTLFWAQATSPDGGIGGLIWGTAVDATAAYYTAVNFDRKPWKLQNGTQLSNAAFGAASLLDGKILWETPVPRNGTSMVQPTVVNDIVLTGLGGPYTGEFTPSPGSFIALDKYTGDILEERILDSFFQAGIAVVHDYVMFGTGYQQTPNGSFNVWQLKSAIIWPEVPYKISIPKRKGNQFIIVTKNDRKDHGSRARTLALEVCKQMLGYILKVPMGSFLTDAHWEHQSYGDSHHAEDFSIWMQLVPSTVADRQARVLDRELAYFALQEFQDLVAVFGAMEGEFEIWAYEFRRARVTMHTWQWPIRTTRRGVDGTLGVGDRELG